LFYVIEKLILSQMLHIFGKSTAVTIQDAKLTGAAVAQT
jgi:hypothetical protein